MNLTRDQILEMPAGPEMDRLVAELVMGGRLDWAHARLVAILNNPEPGWPSRKTAREVNGGRGTYMRCFGCDLNGYGNEVEWGQRCPSPECKPYSTAIAAAWEVVEKLCAHELSDEDPFSLSRSYTTDPERVNPAGEHWRAQFTFGAGLSHEEYERTTAWASAAPLAICRAALLATLEQP